MTAPTISQITVTPNRDDGQVQFRSDMDTFLSEIPTFITETNTLGTYFEDQSKLVQALGNNFQGAWVNLSGAASPPYSVSHQGFRWTLDVSISDVAASEPTGANSDWIPIEAIQPVPDNLVIDISSDAEFLEAITTYAKSKSNFVSNTNTEVTLNFTTGTILSTQLLIDDGTTLGHVKLTSDDAVVTVDSSALQTTFDGSNKPLFGALNNSTLPQINCQFNMDGVAEEVAHHGIYLRNNCSVVIGDSCGVSNAGGNGILAQQKSTVVGGTTCDFSSSGAVGLYLIGSTGASFGGGANFSSASSNGVNVDRASFADLPTVNAQNAGSAGIFASRSGKIYAQGGNASTAGTYGLYTLQGGVINADSITATNCTQHNVYADTGDILISNGTVNNAGTHNVYADDGARITAKNLANCQNAGSKGLFADQGSVIIATGGVNASTAGDSCVEANRGSTIIFDNGIAEDSVASFGIAATTGSTIECSIATVGNNYLSNVYAANNSNIHFNGSTISSNTAFPTPEIWSKGLSRVSANTVTFPSGSNLQVDSGGMIDNINWLVNPPTLNVTADTFTADGFIYQ